MTIPELKLQTGLGERAVRLHLERLRIRPVSMRGRLAVYPPDTGARIQRARLAGARRRAVAIRAALRRARVITVKEAKRRAGRKGAR